MPSLNLAVLAGTLARAPEPRLLPDGRTVWELDISVRPEGQAAASVPVSWADPAVDPAGWSTGDELLVVGAVRRRFYRAGGATVSRTDVLATAVVPARQRKRVSAVLEEALASVSASQPRQRGRTELDSTKR